MGRDRAGVEVIALDRVDAGGLADEIPSPAARRYPFSRHRLVVGYLTAQLATRPYDCTCPWVPSFTRAWRRPAGPSDPRPEVECFQATGFYVKRPNASCPARWRHG